MLDLIFYLIYQSDPTKSVYDNVEKKIKKIGLMILNEWQFCMVFFSQSNRGMPSGIFNCNMTLRERERKRERKVSHMHFFIIFMLVLCCTVN